jgi:hypothetical protein
MCAGSIRPSGRCLGPKLGEENDSCPPAAPGYLPRQNMYLMRMARFDRSRATLRPLMHDRTRSIAVLSGMPRAWRPRHRIISWLLLPSFTKATVGVLLRIRTIATLYRTAWAEGGFCAMNGPAIVKRVFQRIEDETGMRRSAGPASQRYSGLNVDHEHDIDQARVRCRNMPEGTDHIADQSWRLWRSWRRAAKSKACMWRLQERFMGEAI